MKDEKLKEIFNKYKHSYLLNGNNQSTPLMDFNNFKLAIAESNQVERLVSLPTEDEMYKELDRLFNLHFTNDDKLITDDTQLGWERCYQWIKSLRK